MKKILIVGAESKIGIALYQFLQKRNFKVFTTSKKKKRNSYYLNLKWKLEKWPDLPYCDTVICCASIANLKDCEEKKKLTKQINVDGLKKVIKKYKQKRNTQVIFFSSPQVFGINKPFTNVNAIRRPLNNYGKKKKICEDIIIKNHGLVIRVSKILESLNHLLKKWIINLKEDKKIKPYIDQYNSLVPMRNLLNIVLFSIEKNKKGIIHLSATNEINYLEMANILVKKLHLSNTLIEPVTSFKKLFYKMGKHSSLKISNETKKIINLKSSEQELRSYLKLLI